MHVEFLFNARTHTHTQVCVCVWLYVCGYLDKNSEKRVINDSEYDTDWD